MEEPGHFATAEQLIEKLDLRPHPEGGWYRETWRAEPYAGKRSSATAIHFLLEEDQRSRWHRVDADELWLWQAGAPLTLSISTETAGQVQEVTLGPDVLFGDRLQALVPANQWQAAEPLGGWVLVSCIVSPGFDFSAFEIAPEGWQPD